MDQAIRKTGRSTGSTFGYIAEAALVTINGSVPGQKEFLGIPEGISGELLASPGDSEAGKMYKHN